LIPLIEADFDPENMLEQFPEDFECPSCMMIQLDMLECKHCQQLCCKGCLSQFSQVAGKSVANGKFECTICHKVDVFNKQNKILTDILMNLRFQCNSKCKQIYPYNELIVHTQRNLCYEGYIRPDDNFRPNNMSSSKYTPNNARGDFGNRKSVMMANQKPVFDMSGYKDNRPTI